MKRASVFLLVCGFFIACNKAEPRTPLKVPALITFAVHGDLNQLRGFEKALDGNLATQWCASEISMAVWSGYSGRLGIRGYLDGGGLKPPAKEMRAGCGDSSYDSQPKKWKSAPAEWESDYSFLSLPSYRECGVRFVGVDGAGAEGVCVQEIELDRFNEPLASLRSRRNGVNDPGKWPDQFPGTSFFEERRGHSLGFLANNVLVVSRTGPNLTADKTTGRWQLLRNGSIRADYTVKQAHFATPQSRKTVQVHLEMHLLGFGEAGNPIYWMVEPLEMEDQR